MGHYGLTKASRLEHPDTLKKYMEENREKYRDAMRRYREKCPDANAETRNRFNKTIKGKTYTAKMNAERRERSTDPDAFAARVEMLHIIRESCAECYAPYKVSFHIDHILALCLGGTDDWDNLQTLCVRCHRAKTREDLQKFAEAQQDNYAPESAGAEISRLRHLFPRKHEQEVQC